jgi:tetratricopeptide (TPR) repeat protein
MDLGTNDFIIHNDFYGNEPGFGDNSRLIMKRVVSIVFICLIAFVSGAPGQTPRSAQEYNYRGQARQKQGDLDGAIEDFTKAIEQSSGSGLVAAYDNRGQARMLKNDWDGAIADYTSSLELQLHDTAGNKPGSKQAGVSIAQPIAFTYNNRGNARKGKGDLDGAIADYNKALESQPRFAEAYYNRGLAFQTKDELDGALRDYSTALLLAPRLTDAYVNRGQVRQRKNDLDGAIADYNSALQQKADEASTYFARATALQAKKDLEGAVSDYSKTIELDPSSARAYANRGVIRLLQHQDAQADEDFARAFKLEPGLKAEFEKFITGTKRAREINRR